VTSNVEPEEAQAILSMMDGKSRADAEISQRDFRKPCRLNQPQLEEIKGRVLDTVTDLGTFLSDTLSSPCRVDLVGVGEANAEGLFDKIGEHFTMLRFRSRGEFGWLTWDNRAAVTALERIFGTSPKAPEARRLTRLENQVLGNLLANFAGVATEPLEVKLDELVIVENTAQIGSWHDAERDPDSHRLHLEFSIDGEGETSVLHLYLPGFRKETEGIAAVPADAELPAHLREVTVEVTVRLAECEIPLAQLLALEEGDVIPTPVRIGEHATILVEDQEVARGRLGRHRGSFAVRTEELIDRMEES
jgi:flagellar motor switch protein FliM